MMGEKRRGPDEITRSRLDTGDYKVETDEKDVEDVSERLRRGAG
jgi:hypothetical protein